MPRLLPLVAFGALLLAACDATHMTPSTGEAGAAEAIDTVRVVIGGTTVVVTDLDAATPTLEPASVRLDTATTFNGQIVFGEALAAEIEDEAESHLFVYSTSSDAAVVTTTDRESLYAAQNLNDGDYPVGLAFTLRTPNTEGPVDLTVRLNHFDGVAKTSATDAGSATDLTVTIPLVVSGS